MEGAKKYLFGRSPFIEYSCLGSASTVQESTEGMSEDERIRYEHGLDAVEYAKNLEGPRVIKTHLPIEMLPPKVLEIGKGQNI